MDPAEMPVATADDICAEGLRLAELAAADNIPLRIIGGVAFYLRCPSARVAPFNRSYGDVDFVGLSDARAAITNFFEAQGYVQDRMFNALHGAQRLNFADPVRNRPIDVLLDNFRMCHTIDFTDRLLLEPLTVPLTDLLLSKLQVVQLNDKDLKDLFALLIDHGIGAEPGEGISLDRLTGVLRRDWGFDHTVRLNLARLIEASDEYDLSDQQRQYVVDRVQEIVAALERAPKTLTWKARAALGERVQWYELPEEGRR